MTDLDRWSTDDLLALRADVAKYDDSEPRDDHGRWTSDGGGLDAATFQHAGELWTESGWGLMREELARSVPNMEGGVIRRMAVGLLGSVAKAGPSPVPLYRGLQSYDGSADKEFVIGNTVDLNLSSWSSSQTTARDFALTGSARTSYVLRLDPGARALNLTDPDHGQASLSGSHMGEREWLTDGRYTVTDSHIEYSGERLGLGQSGPAVTMVTLRQDGVFTAPDQALGSKAAHGDRDIPLADATFHPAINAAMADRMVPRVRKYSPDQPRDDHGRFTDIGDVALTFPALEGKGDLAAAAGVWAVSAEQMRTAAAASGGAPGSVTVGPGTVRVGAGARAFLNAIADAPQCPVPLYRGLSQDAAHVEQVMHGEPHAEADFAALKDEFQPGKTVDLNLSSWSSKMAVGWGFAGLRDGYVLRVEDAKALNLTDYHSPIPSVLTGASQFGNEHEWITDGRFTVVSTETMPAPLGSNTLVTLRQDGVFTAPEQAIGSKVARAAQPIPIGEARFHPAIEAFMGTRMSRDIRKYDESEPRDDHGRWSSEGGESSGDIRDLSGLKPYTGRGSQSHGTRGYSANLQTAWRAHQVMAAIGIKDYHLLGGPSVFWRDESGIHRYRLKDLEEHAARHTTKAATPVTVDSGGEARDHAVDRIVGRVRQSLVRLAEAAAPPYDRDAGGKP